MAQTSRLGFEFFQSFLMACFLLKIAFHIEGF